PAQIETYVPESKLYNDLHEFEKKLDATISRKKLDFMDALSKPLKTKRTLRVFLSNLASDQFAETSVADNEDLFDLENARAPSWTLKIEGRLLDPANSRKTQPNPPKFSTFLKSVIVELVRDTSLYPEGNLVEWHKQSGAPECDGFEVKRRGDADVNVKVLLYLDHTPEKFKLAPELAKLLDVHTDTLANIVMALWQYVKIHKLQDVEDKRKVNPDEQLRKVCSLSYSKIPFSDLPDRLSRFLLPPDPVVIEHVVTVDKEFSMSRFAYDIEVEVDDPLKERMRGATQPSAAMQKEIAATDDKIAALVQAIHLCKLKRDFMMSFANDPVGFINAWIASQSRDLEVALGDTRLNVEEIRRSEFYAQGNIQEAVFHHLRRKDV
ncbi:SWI/SNF and RSC complex subunit Ssr3, partial [Blyttiomyces helicus]